MYIKDITGIYTIPLSAVSNEMSNEDLYLECDTTDDEVVIYLPLISAMPFVNPRIYISDIAGNASVNPITIRVSADSDDTNNGVVNNIAITQNYGVAKIQPASTTNWITEVVAVGNAPLGFVKIGTIPFAAVNAAAASTGPKFIISKGKPAGMYVKNYFTKVTTAYVGPGALPLLTTIGEANSVNELALTTTGKTISGGINAAMCDSPEGDVNVFLAFTGGAVNPKNFTAGSVDIYAELAPMPI